MLIDDSNKKVEGHFEELRQLYEAYRKGKEQSSSESKRKVRCIRLDEKIRDLNPYFDTDATA